jgi:acyl carrier protein
LDAQDQIKFKTNLRDEIGVDSLDLVEFTMELEEEFRITVPEDVAVDFRTVGDVIEYVARRQEDG